MNEIKEAFSEITAEEKLIQKTLHAVAAQRRQKKPRSLVRKLGLVASAMCMFVLLVVGGTLYTTQTASVSIDVNPSIELSLNRFDRVLVAIPLNEDAEKVLSGLNLKNKTYPEALQAIIASEQALNYLPAGSDVVVAIQSDNLEQRNTLLQKSEAYIGGVAGAQHTTCYAVNSQEWEVAHQHGISPGKYKAILELQEYDSTVTIEEYAHHSMREIRQEIRHHQDGSSQQGSGNTKGGNGQQNNGGQGNGNQGGSKGNGNHSDNGKGHHGKTD